MWWSRYLRGASKTINEASWQQRHESRETHYVGDSREIFLARVGPGSDDSTCETSTGR